MAQSASNVSDVPGIHLVLGRWSQQFIDNQLSGISYSGKPKSGKHITVYIRKNTPEYRRCLKIGRFVK